MSEEEFDEVEFEEEADAVDSIETSAVVHGTDWTTETIVSQMQRGNILLNPRFQRRDAWKRPRKSKLIESLIVGLPVPQIVLAESKDSRGKFLVLDGKQRLLSILQFWGLAEGPNNGFSLSRLELRDDLSGKTFEDLEEDPELESAFNALCNQTLRTVVIRNWKDANLLHTVFLRLNTGSVKLSPQELRQALLPGPFTSYVDDAAAASKGLRTLLAISQPDPRMRDVEILARFLGFRLFATDYPGRMKAFLDYTFDQLNSNWRSMQAEVEEAVEDFEQGVLDLLRIFGDKPARKPGSRQFNRAIFDALIFYQSDPEVRQASVGHEEAIASSYEDLFESASEFPQAIESDTAGAQNTRSRLRIWAEHLSSVIDARLAVPRIPLPSSNKDGSKKKTSCKKPGKKTSSKSSGGKPAKKTPKKGSSKSRRRRGGD